MNLDYRVRSVHQRFNWVRFFAVQWNYKYTSSLLAFANGWTNSVRLVSGDFEIFSLGVTETYFNKLYSLFARELFSLRFVSTLRVERTQTEYLESKFAIIVG